MTFGIGTPARDRRVWLSAVAVVLLDLLLIGWLFREPVVAAVRVWNASETFTHCYLIIPISLYLLWDNRAALARVAPKPLPLALLALLPLLGLQLVGDAASVLELEQFAIVAMAQVVLLAVLGWSVYRVAWFPFLYLFLLVPSGEWLVPALQDFTADFSVGLLRLLGIPTLHDGIFIYIPNGSFRVAEACAGLRFLIASIAYGLLFAYMVYRSLTRRLVFVALSFVIPVIANGFRAFGIIYLAYITDNQVAVAADHILYGWLFFALVLLLLTWVGFGFREDTGPAEPLPPPQPAPTRRIGAVVATGIGAAVLAALGPAYAGYLAAHRPGTEVTLRAPAVEAPWRPSEAQVYDWRIVHPGADAILVRGYENGDALVQLEIAYYAYQREGAEVIGHRNRLYDDETWRRVAGIAGPVAPGGTEMTGFGQRLQRGGRQLVVLSWYWVDGRFTTSRVQAKLLQVRSTLLGDQPAAAQIAVATEAGEDTEAALARLADFAAHLGPLRDRLATAAED